MTLSTLRLKKWAFNLKQISHEMPTLGAIHGSVFTPNALTTAPAALALLIGLGVLTPPPSLAQGVPTTGMQELFEATEALKTLKAEALKNTAPPASAIEPFKLEPSKLDGEKLTWEDLPAGLDAEEMSDVPGWRGPKARVLSDAEEPIAPLSNQSIPNDAVPESDLTGGYVGSCWMPAKETKPPLPFEYERLAFPLTAGYVTTIVLAEGETVTAMLVGDQDMVDASATSGGQVFYMRPVHNTGHTNLIVFTSANRAFGFDLIIYKESPEPIFNVQFAPRNQGEAR